MRVLVIGGTRFIGRRITERFVERGDEVLVVHRGLGEPSDWVRCGHLHVPRAQFWRVAEEVRQFRPDAVVDTLAMTREDAEAVLAHLPDVPLVVLSSMDVYRAYELALSGRSGVPVPLDENSPLRQQRYPHRGSDPALEGYDLDMERYDKLDVEPLYLARGGTVLRLGMVYGEGDPQRREELLLRRVRAGRRHIPVGAGTWLWTRVYVDDIATAVLAAADTPRAAGEIFNIGETGTTTIRDWALRILEVAAPETELIRVPDESLPAELLPTAGIAQHMLASSEKARHELGWQPQDPERTTPRSARWHLEHPPAAPDTDFTADDHELACA